MDNDYKRTLSALSDTLEKWADVIEDTTEEEALKANIKVELSLLRYSAKELIAVIEPLLKKISL